MKSIAEVGQVVASFTHLKNWLSGTHKSVASRSVEVANVGTIYKTASGYSVCIYLDSPTSLLHHGSIIIIQQVCPDIGWCCSLLDLNGPTKNPTCFSTGCVFLKTQIYTEKDLFYTTRPAQLFRSSTLHALVFLGCCWALFNLENVPPPLFLRWGEHQGPSMAWFFLFLLCLTVSLASGIVSFSLLQYPALHSRATSVCR